MSTVTQVMKQLERKGNPQRRELFEKHGAKDKLYGVSVADMKTIAKTIKGEQQLACELYATGNYDVILKVSSLLFLAGALPLLVLGKYRDFETPIESDAD